MGSFLFGIIILGIVTGIVFFILYELNNKEFKINKYYQYLKNVLIFLSLFLCIYIIGNILSNGWNLNLSPIEEIKGGTKVWIGFWGSLFGGLIGTLGVIYVAHIQNNLQKKYIANQDELDNERLRIEMTSNQSDIYLNKMNDYQAEVKKYIGHNKDLIKSLEPIKKNKNIDQDRYFKEEIYLKMNKGHNELNELISSINSTIDGIKIVFKEDELLQIHANKIQKNYNDVASILVYLEIKYNNKENSIEKNEEKFKELNVFYDKELYLNLQNEIIKKYEPYSDIELLNKLLDNIYVSNRLIHKLCNRMNVYVANLIIKLK